MEHAVRRPLRIDHGFLLAAGDELPPVERPELGDPELRAVPGHPRVIPAEPREPPAGRIEPRRHEEVMARDDDLRLGRAVRRQGDELVPNVAVLVPLAHADHRPAVRRDHPVGVAERVRLGGLGRDRPGFRARAVEAIQATVGEIGVEDGVAVVPDRAAAVLVDPRACICPAWREVDDLTVCASLDNGCSAALARAGLRPADAGPLDVDVAVARARGPGDEVGSQRRGPRAVGADCHESVLTACHLACPEPRRR